MGVKKRDVSPTALAAFRSPGTLLLLGSSIPRILFSDGQASVFCPMSMNFSQSTFILR
jgi:hypothetical protein